MDDFMSYLYQTNIFGTTLLLIKKIEKKQIYKLFPISNSLSLDKLYYCMFITSQDEYIIQADDIDIKRILESIEEKQLFNSGCDTINPELYLKFIPIYNRIKQL